MSIALNPASNLDTLIYKRRETFSFITTVIGFLAIVFLLQYNISKILKDNASTEIMAQIEYMPEVEKAITPPDRSEPKKELTPKTLPKEVKSTPKEEKVTKNAVEESSTKQTTTNQSHSESQSSSHAPNTAPSAPAASNTPTKSVDVSANTRYEGLFKSLVEKNKRYPNSREAKIAHPEGVVRLAVELNRAGNVLSAAVIKSSGSNILDIEALRTVRGTEFPPFPANAFIDESTHRFTVAMAYSLASQELVTTD
jgi:TonB family protein